MGHAGVGEVEQRAGAPVAYEPASQLVGHESPVVWLRAWARSVFTPGRRTSTLASRVWCYSRAISSPSLSRPDR